MMCSVRWLGLSSICNAGRFVGGLVPVLAPFSLAAQEPADVTARFAVQVDIEGDIRQGNTLAVTLRGQALLASPQTRVNLLLPSGFTVVSGQVEWSGALAEGESTVLTAQVRLDDKGVSQILGRMEDTTEVSAPRVAKDNYASIYVAVGSTSGFADKELTARFVSPARRELPRLLGSKDSKPDVPDGGSVYLRTEGPTHSSRELTRFLASIDSLGVDALFEDSTRQVGRLRQAIARDRAVVNDTQNALAAPRDIAPLAATALACPAGYWARTGYVQFPDNNNVLQRLPNVLIYAANVPHGFGGGLAVSFRSLSDGSFNQCFPVTSQGYTIITVYQDVGGVYVHRDLTPDPKHVFPQWWDAVWDLTRSSYIPVNTHHPEVSFALATWVKALNASYSIFTARRSSVRAWYFTTADTDRYCPVSFFFSNCTKVGEGIYFHRTAKDGVTSGIYSGYGQFARAHEFGHAWDNSILGYTGERCIGSSHSLDSPDSPGCAMREGFADFFGTITLPLVYLNGEPIRSGSGPRGPEIEMPVANYLFDLIDRTGLPTVRTSSIDDDPVSMDPNYLVRILRDGRTNANLDGPAASVQELIALVDDITPVPAKTQFNAYVQPTALATRVPRSPNITVAQNRALWLKNIFNIVETPPPAFFVTAGAPDYLTVKSTYPLNGTANAPASGWRWDRDDNGTAYTLWASAQNSQFVAYAGDYYISWRLFARRNSDGVTDYGYNTTTVCIQSTPCDGGGNPLLRAPGNDVALSAAAPGSTSRAVSVAANGISPARAGAPRVIDGHFGAGPWLSRDGEQTAIQLYSLAGGHDASVGHAWPNSFALAEGVSIRRSIVRDGGTITATEMRQKSGSAGTALRFATGPLKESGTYHVSYAIDPDLGVRPGDDQLSWIDSIGVAVVADPDSGAVAYGWAGSPLGTRATIREYASTPELLQPESSEQAYQEQRMDSRVIGAPGDVRFALSLGPVPVQAAGQLQALLIVARGANPSEAVANLMNERRRTPEAATLAGTVASAEAPKAFALRQSLGPAGAAFSTGALSEGGSALSARAQLRQFGITALEYAIPGGQVAEVRIRIYSIAGQLVRNLVREQQGSGDYHAQWDGLNERGERVAPGVYVALMEAGTFKATRKLVITR